MSLAEGRQLFLFKKFCLKKQDREAIAAAFVPSFVRLVKRSGFQTQKSLARSNRIT